MNRFSKLAAFAAVLPVLAVSSPALADSPGQLTGGSQVFQVKNLTQNGSYASSVNTACDNEVQYSVRLHNAAFGELNNVVVSVNLSAGTVTATPDEGASAGTTGSVTVTLPAGGSLTYQNGSAQLYDASGNVISKLADTVTTGGVNVGVIRGSTTEFVNFKAKVSCPTPETPKTPVTPKAPETPKATTLPNTGAGDVLGIFAGASAAGAAAHAVIARRRG